MAIDRERIRIRVEEAINYMPFNTVFDSGTSSEILTTAVLTVLDGLAEQAKEEGLAGILIPAPKGEEQDE